MNNKIKRGGMSLYIANANASKTIITDDLKIRQFIEDLTPEEQVILFKQVTTSEYIGLIAEELKKEVPEDPSGMVKTDPEFFVKHWKFANSPTFLVAIAPTLQEEVTRELDEMMKDFNFG